WRPRRQRHFALAPASDDPSNSQESLAEIVAPAPLQKQKESEEALLTTGQVVMAWAPYAIMSLFLFLTGLVRQHEPRKDICLGPLKTKYAVEISFLHEQVKRDPYVVEESRRDTPEKAIFDVPWLTAPGSAVLAAAVMTVVMLRMSRVQVKRVVAKTFFQMRIP